MSLMILANIFLLCNNLVLSFLIYHWFVYKNDKFNKYVEGILKDLEPRIYKDSIQNTEYCFVCNGNGIKPASLHHNLISIHPECRDRVENNEVKIKEVGRTLDNQSVNILDNWYGKSYKKIGFNNKAENKKVL